MSGGLWVCYLTAWKKSFVYRGCSTRLAFWSFIIMNLLIFLFIGAGSYFLLVEVIADKTSAGGMALVWAYFIYLPLQTFVPLILIFPVLAFGVRRMHDVGKSGWWFGGLVLIELFVLPIVGIFVYYILRHFMDDANSQQISRGINMGFSIIVAVTLVWLCCMPTKIKYPTSSSDVMN